MRKKKYSPTIRLSLLMGILLFALFHPFIISHMIINSDHHKSVYFAGGCFWCMEPVFDVIPGVKETISGYLGGNIETANYAQVSTGTTKHYEAIKVIYDPNEVSYNVLVDAFWKSIDPTDDNGQFADKGPQYQTAIFYTNDSEKEIAIQSKNELELSKKFDKPIVTKIIPSQEFFPAEDDHQNYYQKNSIHYNAYKIGSGRAGFLKKTWNN